MRKIGKWLTGRHSCVIVKRNIDFRCMAKQLSPARTAEVRKWKRMGPFCLKMKENYEAEF